MAIKWFWLLKSFSYRGCTEHISETYMYQTVFYYSTVSGLTRDVKSDTFPVSLVCPYSLWGIF